MHATLADGHGNPFDRARRGRHVKPVDSRRTSLARGAGLPEPLLLEDPMEALPPTAQRMLAAARRLLAGGGFDALSLSAIARRPASPRPASATISATRTGSSPRSSTRWRTTPTAPSSTRPACCRPATTRAGAPRRRVAHRRRRRRRFSRSSTCCPHALRDPALRERVAALYKGYRETVMRCLDADDEATRAAPATLRRAHDRHRRRPGDPARPRSARRQTCAPPSSSGSSWCGRFWPPSRAATVRSAVRGHEATWRSRGRRLLLTAPSL